MPSKVPVRIGGSRDDVGVEPEPGFCRYQNNAAIYSLEGDFSRLPKEEVTIAASARHVDPTDLDDVRSEPAKGLSERYLAPGEPRSAVGEVPSVDVALLCDEFGAAFAPKAFRSAAMSLIDEYPAPIVLFAPDDRWRARSRGIGGFALAAGKEAQALLQGRCAAFCGGTSTTGSGGSVAPIGKIAQEPSDHQFSRIVQPLGFSLVMARPHQMHVLL